MSIFKTLRLDPKSYMKLGKPQIQSPKTVFSYISSTRKAKDFNARAVLKPVNTALSRVTGLVRTNSSLTRIKSPTLTALTTSIIKNKNFLLPSSPRIFNTVRPSYKAVLKPKALERSNFIDDATQSTKIYEPYERLTGISHERPEVVLLSEFAPLFTSDIRSQPDYENHFVNSGVQANMTDAGLFIDAQINSRNLKSTNVVHMFRTIRRKNFQFHNVFRERRDKLRDSLSDLVRMVQFLLEVVRKMDQLKRQLDLRDDIHTVKPADVIKNLSLNFTKTRSSWLYNELQRSAGKYLPESYDIVDVLERLGYERKSVKDVFSSSKLWLQMLEEFKDILNDHSLEFLDIATVSQRNDDNATVLNKKDSKVFGLSLEDPNGGRIPFLNEIVGFAPSNVKNATNQIARSFGSIYDRGAFFRSEEARIAALANIISKEFKFSRGLANPSVRQTLSDAYGYTVNDGPTARSTSTNRTSSSRTGNANVFDQIIGRFTNNVADVQESPTNNTLVGVAQSKPDPDTPILTFESSFLEGDNGSVVPGSAYFIDNILNLQSLSDNEIQRRSLGSAASGVLFNTGKLGALARHFSNSAAAFGIIADGMNLYGVSEFDSTDRDAKKISSNLGNVAAFTKKFVTQFVDDKGVTLPMVRKDRLTSIFALARKNPMLRAQLFLFYMNRIARAYSSSPSRSFVAPITGDNTPFTDQIVKDIVNSVSFLSRSSRLIFGVRRRNARNVTQVDANDLTSDVLKSSLKKGTKLSRTIENLMKTVLDEFVKDGAISVGNDRTLFGGHMDTVIMMTVFDMIISIIARYGNQELTGRSSTGFQSLRSGQTITFFVAQRQVKFRNAINDLINRTRRELALTQQITWCVLNTLTRLGDEATRAVNYFNSTTSIQQLRAVGDVIDNNEELRQLMSEHQIMMLGSLVYDIAGKFYTRQASDHSFVGDVDADGDFDSDDEIAILDDSLVSPKIRDILYGYFKLPGMTGETAANKKVMTVGLPLGFSRRLNQKVKVSKQKRSSFNQKQNDVIEVLVYKLDLLNQDIIYHPLKFLFELSRFPVRNDGFFRAVPDGATADDIAKSFPMRDFEEAFEEGSSLSYWNPDNEGDLADRIALDADSYDFLTSDEKEQIVNNHLMSYMCEIYLRLLTGIETADHNFDIDMEDEKDIRPVESEFIRTITTHRMNHISRFTGFNSQFAQRIPDTGPSLISGRTRQLSSLHSPRPGALFNSTLIKSLPITNTLTRHNLLSTPRLSSFSGVASSSRSKLKNFKSSKPTSIPVKTAKELERSTLSLSTSLNDISERKVYSAVQALRTISHFTRIRTSLSDGGMMQKGLMRPKQFDRVFNLLIDPDDFEIDYDKTMETEFGKETFNTLLKRGEIEPSGIDRLSRNNQRSSRVLFKYSVTQGSAARRAAKGSGSPAIREVSNFRSKRRDAKEGDASFEKYFVVVKTYGEEDV